MNKLKIFLLLTLVLIVSFMLLQALLFVGGVVGYLIAGNIGRIIGQIVLVSMGLSAYLLVAN